MIEPPMNSTIPHLRDGALEFPMKCLAASGDQADDH